MGNVNNVDGLASILGSGVSSLPLKYLGLLLEALLRPNLFGMLLLRRSCIVSVWKMTHLSKDDRITLFLSVGVVNRIKKFQRDISWGGLHKGFKFHLVS